GLVAPQTGTMTRDGEPFHPQPHRLTTLGIARTLQGGGLFDSLTVLENVMAGARDRPRTGMGAALNWLRRAGGEEGEVRERALAARRGLLLLDEPAGGLTDEEVDELGGFTAGLRRRRRCAVLLVEHRLDLVMRVCETVVVLDLGRVIAWGTPDEIRADPAVAA